MSVVLNNPPAIAAPPITPPPTRGPGKGKHIAAKRVVLRNSLWSDAEGLTWNRQQNDGFTTIPRLLPLVLHLIRTLAKKGDPTKAYVELWSRVYDEGLVIIENEADHAYAAGYSGTRAERTWTEHIWELQRIGFIRVKGKGARGIAYILILNPLVVCTHLHKQKKTPLEWWTAFVGRASEVGTKLPSLDDGEKS